MIRIATTLGLALSLAACTTTQHTTEDTFQTYAHALGSSDIDTMMTMYAEDAQWTVDQQVYAQDRDAVRRSYDYEQGLGAERTISSWEAEGDNVRVFQTESNDFFCLFGVNEIESLTVYGFENGQITTVETTRDPKGLAMMAPAVTEFFQWLETTYPEFCASLMDEDGRFCGSEEHGTRLVELAETWFAQNQTHQG